MKDDDLDDLLVCAGGKVCEMVSMTIDHLKCSPEVAIEYVVEWLGLEPDTHLLLLVAKYYRNHQDELLSWNPPELGAD